MKNRIAAVAASFCFCVSGLCVQEGTAAAQSYAGGPVMTSGANIYLIFYGNFSTSTQNLLANLATNLPGSPYLAGLEAYFDANGTPILNSKGLLGGGPYNTVTLATSSFGASLGDNSFSRIVSATINGLILPNDPSGIYVVVGDPTVTYQGLSGTLWNDMGGFHSHFSLNGNDLKFAFVGDPMAPAAQAGNWNLFKTGGYSSPNNNQEADNIAPVIAHEVVEAITDPDVVPMSNPSAWTIMPDGPNGPIDELADACQDTFTDEYSPNFSIKVFGTNFVTNTALGGVPYLLPQYIQNYFPSQGRAACNFRPVMMHQQSGDFDGDGFADYADWNTTTGEFWAHRNLQNMSFSGWGQNIAYANTGCTAKGLCTLMLGDFNGDRRTDYATRDQNTGVFKIYLNNGWGGNYSTPATFSQASGWGGTTCAGSGCNGVLVGDFTGDGKADFADFNYAQRAYYIHNNLGNGTFSGWGQNWAVGTINIPLLTEVRDLWVGDFNHDGTSDVLVDYDSSAQSFRASLFVTNAANRTITAGPSYTTTGNPGTGSVGAIVGDYNGDGFADVGFIPTSGAILNVAVNSFNSGGSTFNLNTHVTANPCGGKGCKILGEAN